MTTKLRTVQAAAATGGGNQDFTVAGFGTPNAVFFTGTYGLTNGTVADGFGFLTGAAASTSSRNAGFTRSADNVSPTGTNRRWGATDEAILFTSKTDPNVLDGEADFNAFITDGARVTWGDNPSAAFLINALLVTAPNVAVGVGTHTGAVGVEQSFSVGFEPDVVLFYGNTTSITDADKAYSSVSIGVAINDGASGVASQWGCAMSGHATNANAGGGIWSDAVYVSANPGGGTNMDRAMEATGFSSTTFDLTKRGLSSSDHVFHYLAFTLDSGVSAHAEIIDTRTTTGSQAYTNPGFTPQCLVMVPGFWDAVQTGNSQVDTTAAGADMMALALVDATNQYCACGTAETDVDPTNTASLTAAQVADIISGDQTAEFDVTLTSFDANGYTLQFDATNGTVRKWGVLAIEADTAAVTLTAAQGAYTLSGQDVALEQGHVVAASQGSYALSGQGVGLLYGRALAAGQGTYALAGQNAGLLLGRTIAAAQGSYALSGQDVALEIGHLVAAAQGSYALTGQTVTLVFTPVGAFILAADQGAYTLAGQDAALEVGRLVTADQGTYALAGQIVDLLRDALFAADQGAYTIAGQDVAFARTRLLLAAQGSYALGGQDATLVYAPVGAFIVAADQGTYALAGQAVDLLHSNVIAAAQGAYVLSGQATGLLLGRAITAAQGAYALAGQDVTFLRDFPLAASLGTYTLTGQAVTFPRIYRMLASQGTYALAGQSVILIPGTTATYRAGALVGPGSPGAILGPSTAAKITG